MNIIEREQQWAYSETDVERSIYLKNNELNKDSQNQIKDDNEITSDQNSNNFCSYPFNSKINEKIFLT